MATNTVSKGWTTVVKKTARRTKGNNPYKARARPKLSELAFLLDLQPHQDLQEGDLLVYLNLHRLFLPFRSMTLKP